MRLPVELGTPSNRLQHMLVGLWVLIAAVALIGQVGGIRSGQVQFSQVDPVFAALGLHASWDSIEGVTILDPADPDEVPPALVAVGEVDVVGKTPAEIAALLPKQDGQEVNLTIVEYSGEENQFPFVVDQTLRSENLDPTMRRAELFQYFSDGFLVFPFLLAGGLLLWRHRGEPVPLMLAFAFAGFAVYSPGADLFWNALALPELVPVASGMAIAAFVAAVPAFPDGRFVPAIGRWSLVVAPIVFLLFVESTVLMMLPYPVVMGAVGAAMVGSTAMLAIRYRRTPRGQQRQQIKWAAFGIFAGILLILIGSGLAEVIELAPEMGRTAFTIIFLASIGLSFLGLLLLPLGVIMSMMRWRLNDADAVVGRSFGYAGITLAVGVVWAVAATVTNKWVTELLGANHAAITTASSTLLAALIFTPARTRMLGWTEKKFQAALVRLRSLPGKLARLQAVETPAEIADNALGAILSGVDAVHAALCWRGEGAPVVLAARNIDPDHALCELDADRPEQAGDDPFPLRLALVDEGQEYGTLMIGPRGDGAAYTKTEALAVRSILVALTEAIRTSSRQSRLHDELKAAVSQLHARLAMIETPVAHAAS